MAIPGPVQRIYRWTPFLERVAMILAGGMTPLQKFGRNSDISAAADEDIWEGGGDYVFPSAAETLSVESTSDQDLAGGTGCATVEIFGLDANYLEISELVILTGSEPVITTKFFLRAHRATCRTPGATSITDMNAGIITATQTTSGAVLIHIGAGDGQTLLALFTVPANQTLLVERLYASVGRQVASALSATFIARPFGECFQVKHSVDTNSLGGSLATIDFRPPVPFAGKTDLRVRASVTGNGVMVNGGFDGVLYETDRFEIGD